MITYLNIIFGVLGLITLTYAVWIKNDQRRGILAAIGGAFLLVYSISVHDAIFIILQIVFIVSSLIEVIKISKKNNQLYSKSWYENHHLREHRVL
jgi:lipid-A-disaccharide synthase-like uncharacterized protein